MPSQPFKTESNGVPGLLRPDLTLTVDKLYEWHRLNLADSRCIVWAEGNGGTGGMTWNEFGLGVDRAAVLLQEQVAWSPESADGSTHDAESKDSVTVGILSTSDSVTYSAFLLALERLTYPASGRTKSHPLTVLPFPFSTRNSAAATAHLLSTAKVNYIYVSDGPMRDLLDEALGQEAYDCSGVQVLKMPMFSDLYPDDITLTDAHASPAPTMDFSPVLLDTPALILHSSGSTSFPKPITLTHRMLVEWGHSLELGGLSVKDEVLAIHGSPMFHAMGVITMLWSAVNPLVRAVSKPNSNLPPPTPEYFISQIVSSKATVIYCVPSFIEAWAEDEANVKVLQNIKAIMYSGAPLSPKVGAFLRRKGVNLHCLLGATEFGQPCAVPAKAHPEGSEWFAMLPTTDPYFEPQTDEDSYELIFKQSPGHHPSPCNTQIDGVPAYATNDLVEQHPTNKKLWRVKGRKDDQIMLSTGEKTNPGPLENIIKKNNHVKGAVLFGRGRLQNGIVVEPISWTDFPTEEEFRDAVWPNVKEANTYAPSHSRIFKEMILVSSPEKPFSYTLKGTPRRGAIVKDYAPEIEALYNAIRESSQMDIQAPIATSMDAGWSMDETVAFVRDVVLRVVNTSKKLGDDDDLFEAGCDSLEATYIRNSVLRALRESAPLAEVHELPSNFVYNHPTIRELGIYVALASGNSDAMNMHANGVQFNSAQAQMDFMVHKYTRDFMTHVPSSRIAQPMGEVILLTGSTGGLGSQLLARLVVLPGVLKIYALNRQSKGDVSVQDRQRAAYIDRGNDPVLLDSEKVVFVEGDTSSASLGISDELFSEICDSVTVIIHNAWQVDFKMALPSFEPVIRGVRSLIDFALRSPHPEPPRILFTSSIGILRNWLPNAVPEAPVVDPSLITDAGYGQSKWVSERILLAAAAVTPLKPIIVRVGQLSGGTNGCWNIQEWFPSLLRGSQIMGCVPDHEGLVSWLPLHVAAAALIELRDASFPIAHLVHPRPVLWSTIIKHIATLLGIPLVPYSVWVARLASDNDGARVNPSRRLLDFYKASERPKDDDGSPLHLNKREAIGLATLQMEKTANKVQCLGIEQLSQLGEKDVASWILYWKKKYFLTYN